MNTYSLQATNDGTWVLVTGASSGIGRATVLALAHAGYRVLGGVRTTADMDSLNAEQQGIVPLILDVTIDEHLQQLPAKVEHHTGGKGLGGLVNNAGINYVCPFANTEERRARELLEVNLFGLARVSQALLPQLRQHVKTRGRTAKLINVSSIGGTVGIPWESFYHASKFAIVGLSEALRMELRRERIIVSCVLPGGIRTPFIRKSAENMRAAHAQVESKSPAHYAAAMDKLADASALVEKFGSHPEKVAHRIKSILHSEQPGFKHLVGMDAWILYLMSKAMPSRVRHAMLSSMFAA